MEALDPPRNLLRQIAGLAAALVSFSGLAVILGWIFNKPLLRGGFTAAGIEVKTNAGIALLCCGASLGLQSLSSSRRAARLAQILALIVLVLGALTLSEHIIGWNLGIDQLLFKEPA